VSERPIRTALVHDWLTGMRGGEKVLEVLAELYPDAHLFTLVHRRGSVSPTIERLRTRTSFVQRLPFVDRYYRHCLPLFPAAVEAFDLDGYDLVVSSSHCAAKSVIRAGRARHLCYCLTPMRYAWDQYPAYFGPDRVGWLPSRLLRPTLAWLARWDRATAWRADRYVAISRYVAGRIRRYYNRPAEVVYPPVDTAFYHPDGRPRGDGVLIVSALVPYKRLDLAIEACRAVRLPLRIVGQGPELGRLQRLGGPGVEFFGTRTNEEIRELYRDARVVILPGEEDFGIVPLEAQACGCPVVALARGGALETVIDGTTGVLFAEPSAQSLGEALASALATRFDPGAIRAHAERFGRDRFAAEMKACIEETLTTPTDARSW
jgi:glycosyltransferase involved in cell wall biosynthesis